MYITQFYKSYLEIEDISTDAMSANRIWKMLSWNLFVRFLMNTC